MGQATILQAARALRRDLRRTVAALPGATLLETAAERGAGRDLCRAVPSRVDGVALCQRIALVVLAAHRRRVDRLSRDGGAWIAVEFCGHGDPAFGGAADDRALYLDHHGQPCFERKATAHRDAMALAMFETEAEAIRAADMAPRRARGSVACWRADPARQLTAVDFPLFGGL
jgi:hypothetical protein